MRISTQGAAKLAGWLSVRLPVKWFWVRVLLQSLDLRILLLLRAEGSLAFGRLWGVDWLWGACAALRGHAVGACGLGGCRGGGDVRAS